MPELTTALSQDSQGLFFAGPANYLPAGTRVGSTDYAIGHILLVDSNNNPLVMAVDMDSGAGTVNRIGVGLMIPGSGGPTLVGGDSTLGLSVRMLGGAGTPAKYEDSATGDQDIGMSVMAVRRATPVNSSGADGDYEFLQMHNGRLWVSALITDIVPATGPTNLGKAEDDAHASGDTGVMFLGVRKDIPTSLQSTDGDYAAPTIDSMGATWIREQTVTSAVPLTLTSSTTSATLAAGNGARRGMLLNNTDEYDVYINYDDPASLTAFAVRIPSGGYWEMPKPIYVGLVSAIWAGDGSGSLIGVEL